MRDSKNSVKRIAKSNDSLYFNVFKSFFITECRKRFSVNKYKSVDEAFKRFDRLLAKQARVIFDFAEEHEVDPMNVSFIFLNRYYAVFVKDRKPLSNMIALWDEFVMSVINEDIFKLLNYSSSDREIIISMIKEIHEAKKSEGILKFIKNKCNNYKVKYPTHISERSKFFEVALLMFNQLKENKLYYYLERHAIEILKAHFFYLKKFGNPIVMQLGHFVGDNAMYRLKQYADNDRNTLKRSVRTFEF